MDKPGRNASLPLLCWLVYFAANLGRLNLSVNISAVSAAEGISKDELGLMASLFFFAYGGGQLLSGIIAERVRPGLLVGLGIFFTGAANLAVALSNGVRIMQICWFLNGAAQSFLWIPMLRILAENLPKRACVRACVHINATGPAGMFCAYGISAVSLYVSGWRMSFFASAFIILCAAALWALWFLKNALRENRREAPSGGPPNPAARWPLRRLGPCLAFLAGAACLHGILKDGVGTWLPAYLVDTFAVSASHSAALALALPLFNLAGVYTAHYLNRMIFKNEIDCSLLFFAAVLAALLALVFVPGHIAFSFFGLGLVTAAMTAINTLFITLIPLRFTRTGRVAIVTGLLNTSTYIGSGAAGYGFGRMAEHLSWNAIVLAWCGTAAAAVAVCLAARGAWARFTARRP
jgi:OPA family glycerol-3-phosphate transporter-like MFS transporter